MSGDGDQDASLSALTAQVRSLAQLVSLNHASAEDAHSRIRREVDRALLITDNLNLARESLTSRISMLESRQISAASLVMTTTQTFGVIAFCCSLILGGVGVYVKLDRFERQQNQFERQQDQFEKQQQMQRALLESLRQSVARLEGQKEK